MNFLANTNALVLAVASLRARRAALPAASRGSLPVSEVGYQYQEREWIAPYVLAAHVLPMRSPERKEEPSMMPPFPFIASGAK